MDEEPGRQARWQELSKSECFALLARERLGRVAVVDDRGPVVFPVNFVLDRHMVVFRAGEGTKLDAACRGSRVAFEIDGADAAAHTGWSVLVRGEAIEVTGPAELARLRKLPLDPWAPGAKAHYVRILPAVLTGRRIWAPGGAAPRGGEPPPGAAAAEDGEAFHGNRHRPRGVRRTRLRALRRTARTMPVRARAAAGTARLRRRPGHHRGRARAVCGRRRGPAAAA